MIAEIIVAFLDGWDEGKRRHEKEKLDKFNQEFYAWLEEYHKEQSRKAL